MEKITRLKPEQREDLVAYLDGELESEKTQAIDRALGESPVARHEVEMLTRTWEMLDLLPQEKAPETFTQTTMQTIRLEESSGTKLDVQRFAPQVRLALMAVVWLLCVSLSSWLGFTIANQWVVNPTDQLVDDLPVIQNLELYQSLEIDDGDGIDFLKELERTGALNE
ncbi:MAG: hypothetical protein HUJ26_12450 [Planctomycetaceae bacterium]|nr:hypothetical protein [Planctomycetaceae bacterium]